MTSETQTYLNEVRAREQAAAEGSWGLYRDPANPDVPKLLKMLERALTVLEEWKDSGESDFKDALSDIEQIARGELK